MGFCHRALPPSLSLSLVLGRTAPRSHTFDGEAAVQLLFVDSEFAVSGFQRGCNLAATTGIACHLATPSPRRMRASSRCGGGAGARHRAAGQGMFRADGSKSIFLCMCTLVVLLCVLDLSAIISAPPAALQATLAHACSCGSLARRWKPTACCPRRG